VRVVSDASDLEIEGLVNALNARLPTGKANQYTVQNLRVDVKQTLDAATFITLVFNVVAVIGVIFSFFVLWLSFMANIKENSWEFGVLRAIGVDVSFFFSLLFP
jgi:ABC-type antimicrobial peptide transport system permease subunit